jgi:hypothetical protein
MGEENISNTFEYFNPSPSGAKVGDCVIRALCKALNKSWEDVYVQLCVQGFIMHDLPNSDPIWGAYRMSAPNDKAKRAVDKMIDELEN